MDCQLIILDAIGQGQPGTTLMSLKVTGSASGCSSLGVTILCTGQHPVQHNAVPIVGGQWETTFTEQELKLAGCRECGSSSYPLEVRARCDDGVGECSNFKSWPAIPCLDIADCCPTVSIEVTEGACDAQGRRNVTFRVTTTPATGAGCPDTVFAQLDFGDGMLGAGFIVPPDSVWVETHSYLPGSYTAKVHIIAPLGCPDIPVKVGPLAECPPGCPDPDDITVTVDDCDPEGRRIVLISVYLPGSGSTTVSVDWHDGTPPDANLPIQGGAPWTAWHHYLPPGPYKVTVSVTGCPPITKPVGPLEACPQPPPPDGGNGDGHHPCPWWNPFCKGWNLCAAILALALAFILGAAIALIVVGCSGNYLAAFITMLVSFLIAAGLLYLWYRLCAKLDVDFCDTLDQLIHVLFIWIIVQPFLIGVVAAIAWLISVVFETPLPIAPCGIGAIFSWAYFATILTYLLQIRHMAHCPGEAPTHV